MRPVATLLQPFTFLVLLRRLMSPPQRGREPVGASGYLWHEASDGCATFPVEGGGWILVSNCGGARGRGVGGSGSARAARLEDAYGILSGTSQNCSGGGTPWGTWLSCEETKDGLVWNATRPAVGRLGYVFSGELGAPPALPAAPGR
jgi:hypothetical protein